MSIYNVREMIVYYIDKKDFVANKAKQINQFYIATSKTNISSQKSIEKMNPKFLYTEKKYRFMRITLNKTKLKEI